MSALTGCAAAWPRMGEGPQWAGHVSYVAVRPRLCKARFLRIAAVSMANGESLLSTHPVDGPMHALQEISVGFGLGAAIRRVSHEQQLWAVFPGLRVGSIRLSMNGMARRLVLGLLNLAGCAPT
jgi:hypothetical protein